MSKALAKAPKLSPHDRLDQAVSEFKASLSSEQRSQFNKGKSPPTPSDVMKLSEEVDVHMSQKFGGRCFGPRFTNFLQGVQQFAALGDILIGGSQNLIACGVWSLVRISLLSFVSVSNHVDKLSSIFMDIGRSAPRHQAIAELYPRSTKLPEYLSEYFIVVVRLCQYLYELGQKSTLGQITSSLNQTALTDFQTDLDKWASSIREEMRLREAQENSGFREESRLMLKFATDEQKLAKKRRVLAAKAATKNQVLDFFSTYDHETARKQLRKAGNTLLHKHSKEYREWKDSPGSCTLVFSGKLGSGKSVLLANIVGDLNFSTEKERPLVAYFFCRHDVQESLKARTILGSLARQLLQDVSDLDMISESCVDTHIPVDVYKITKLLLEGYSPSHKTYFVIDGLDECDYEERMMFVEAVKRMQGKLKLLVCASFQVGPKKDPPFTTNQLRGTRIVPLPEDNPDIKDFIKAELDRCLEEKRLTIGVPELILEIEEALLQGTKGMFLWVALQIQSLCNMKTDDDIRKALKDLPKDLPQTFSRILDRSGSSDPSLQAKTLQVVLAACQPLTTEELRDVLSVNPGDTIWDPSKILNDVQSALACCGSLLIVDEEELTVRVVHHSVKKYLSDTVSPLKSVPFSLKIAQRTLADIVVTYLGYDIFETEISTVVVRPMLAQSAPYAIVRSMPPNVVTQLARTLLKDRKRPILDVRKTIAEAGGSFKPQSKDSRKFFAYAKTHWPYHILYVSGQDAGIYRLAAKLIRGRMSESQVWDAKFEEYHRITAERGNEKILELLIQSGKMYYLGNTPIVWAIKDKDKDTLKVLLDAGVDLDAGHRHGLSMSTPLILAARYSSKEIVELLLSTGKVDVNARDYKGHTALRFAGSHFNTDIAKLLLQSEGIEVDAKDNIGFTALMHAANEEDFILVRLLLATGKANVNMTDNHGDNMPLMLAASRGSKYTVKLLLATGQAELNGKNSKGQTPLMMASSSSNRYDNKGVVELLLGTGEVDPFLKDSQGWTALDYAKSKEQYQIVSLLESYMRR